MTLSQTTSQPQVTKFTIIISTLFFLFAYLGGLDTIPLRYDNDEGRRAIVTAEMMLSGDYLTPTINGEIYLNKPPLYNWIVAVYFKIFGDYSMFAFRLQVIVAILLTGVCIYHFTKKYTNQTIAFFTAFAFMTNGRILIYDSFIGLIDTTFTLTVYLSFMLIYYCGEKKKYYQLFLLSYLLAAIGFLMKGIPAVVFLSLSLLTYFIWKRKFKTLFHPSHFAGIALFLLILAAFYVPYLNKNQLDPLVVFGNLLTESSKRTPGHFSISRTLGHLFSFPLEMLYHFAPWTLFVIAFLQKNIGSKLKQNDFIFYSLLIFLVNFPVYWLSPEVYARYLFMFLPLIYSVCFYLFFETLSTSDWQHKLINAITVGAPILLLIGFITLPFTSYLNQPIFYPIALAIIMTFLVWFSLKFKTIRLFVFLLSLLVFRMAFNWFVLTERIPPYREAKERAYYIASITKGKPLYILKGSEIGNFDGASFHISTQRGEVLKIREMTDTSAFYISDLIQLKTRTYTNYFTFQNFYAPDSLRLVKFH